MSISRAIGQPRGARNPIFVAALEKPTLAERAAYRRGPAPAIPKLRRRIEALLRRTSNRATSWIRPPMARG